MSNLEMFVEKNEVLNKHSSKLQELLDTVKDENVTLKLKISDLEGDILDERLAKQVKLDMNVDCFRNQLHEQFLSEKVKFEENLMSEKQ